MFYDIIQYKKNGKALFLFKYNITPFYFYSILFETMKIWGRRLEHAEGLVFEFQPQTNENLGRFADMSS